MDNFQEAALICRPRDVFGFAVRYFRDEKQATPEEAHAIHMLPFLLVNHKQFKSAACTIYCQQINNDSNFKNFLDGSVVLDIINRMDLESYGLQIKSIDDVSAISPH